MSEAKHVHVLKCTLRIVVPLLALAVIDSIVFAQVARTSLVTEKRTRRKQVEVWLSRGRESAGEVSAVLRHRALAQKIQMRGMRQPLAKAVPASSQISNSGWSSLGPTSLASDASGVGEQDYGWVSGRATAVAIDPADPTGNTVYVGAASGGVWKSSNAASRDPSGVSWTPLTDGQATLAVGAVAVQPQLSNANAGRSVILVGTGEANSSTDSYYGLGILRSANAGQSWALLSSDSTGTRSFAGLAFSKIAFSTTNPNLVVAATAGASEGILEGLANPLTANLGLYYSQDAGNSWAYANVADGSQATRPGSATSIAYNGVIGQFFATIRYHGFYSSSDGVNWTRLANQPGTGLTNSACPAQSASSTCPIYRGEIAIVPGRNEMYVWFVDANDNDQGIWKSANGGTSWSLINDTGITNCGDDIGCGTEDGTYNLTLAAVPDGGATDLYAGAINLYKCQITSAVPDCGGAARNTFINLTHAYGCSSIAKLHPAQHAISFLMLNNNDLMYFANDGGVYRALDGFGGLTTGSCGSSNQFDSLNETLGPLMQFVSFSEATGNNGYPILGGTQGNGAPATESAAGDSSWLDVNAGNVGYTQINPGNPDEWFVSTPPDSESGINIYRCESGINCHTEDFENDEVVSSVSVGGDTGGLYAPYILDPQNSSELIVGTCRVWRGSTNGSGFSVLSNNFETGGSGICTGSETNLVRSLAASGPLDEQKLSTVIYAGTDGYGPLIPTIPGGGQIWVSTNSTDENSWADQTGAINPGAFPISSIAVDNADASGLTAYLTIMGFGVSHVWKTTSGGATWIDFSGNLPDAPVNAVLVDSSTSPSIVYVGTDVGVFSSPSVSPSWAEVGPSPASGQSGYLPNVAVTALQMFNDGRDKWLRASTYGRGIWQFPLITTPDFLITISNTPLTVFAGSKAVFEGTAFALDGYSNSVRMTCSAGVTAPPPTCLANPSSLTPSSSGISFAIDAAGPAGVYRFNVHAIGSDGSSTTHDAADTLNVVDFNLTAPSVTAVTVGAGVTSGPINFQVSAAGPFSQAVTLLCFGLPSGTACNFEPSNSVSPSANNPIKVAMTITTASNTPAGHSSVTIVASVAGGPSKTQPLSLNVGSDFSLSISNPSISAVKNSTGAFQGKLTNLNGYTSSVNLTCGSGASPTCKASPASLSPTASGAPFTVTVGSNTVQTYDFQILATGTDSLKVSHSVPVVFSSTTANSTFTFSINPSSQSESIAVGETAKFQMTLSPCTLCGPFPSIVNLSYSGCPPLSTCSLSRTNVAAASGATNVSLNVVTTAAVLAENSPMRWKWWPAYAASLWLPGLLLMINIRKAGLHFWARTTFFLFLIAGTLVLVSSCGGGLEGGRTASANPGTPAGSYFLTVTATMTSSPSTPSQTADLTVVVQ